MKHTNTASRTPLLWSFCSRSFLVVVVALFLVITTLFQRGERVVNADARIGTGAKGAAFFDPAKEPLGLSNSSSTSMTPGDEKRSPDATFAAGGLDLSFGNGGIVTTGLTGGIRTYFAAGTAIQSDGKIVAVGEGYTGSGPGTNWDFAVARYNTNGSLDTSFGGIGIILTAIGNAHDGARSVAIQADGKIVAAGYNYNGGGFAVIRYNTDGSLDTSFNGTGIVTTIVGNFSEYVNSVAIRADGKIVVAGLTSNGSDSDFALVRYNTNGSLDTSFNGTGKVITPIGTSYDYAASVAVQEDGKTLVAGYSYNDVTGSSFAVVRYTTFGQLDTSFNGTGKAITTFGDGFSGASGLAIQWDGKIVAAGYSDRSPSSDFALVRYNPDGELDASFGGTGKVIIPVGNARDYADSVAIQPDGKIVAAGASFTGTDSEFALVRVNSNGSLDTTFNGTGKIITVTPGNQAASVAIQADGKIVAAGGYNDEIFGFMLVRYHGGPFRVNGKIAFVSDRDREGNVNPEIYVMNSDGSNQVRLTNNDVLDHIPAFSPDGRKIAYVSQIAPGGFTANIKIMNADGTNQTVLTSVTLSRFPDWADWEYSSLSWSPDGSKIAFDDGGEIFTVNVDGSNRTNLTNQPGDDIAPAWSPDGSRILFTSHRVGYLTMHTMKPDGSDVKVLPSQFYSWDVSPDWSPTGDKIIFVELSEDWFPFIKTADADGTNRRVFDGSFGSSATRNKPKWSPDLTKIVFHNYQFPNMDCEIFVKNVDGTGLTQLTNTFGNNGQPSWQMATSTISGTITYGNAIGSPTPRFVSNVLISGAGLPDVSATSLSDGSYSLSGFGGGAYTVTPSKTGGVNGITSFDAGKVAQHVAGTSTLTGNALIVADVSGNGIVSSFDAGQIALFVANGSGMQTGTWKFAPVSRTYASVAASVAGEDFIALLMGEVSGNWTPVTSNK